MHPPTHERMDHIVRTNNAPSEITLMHCDTSIVDWTAMRKLEIISSLQLTASVWIWYKKNLSISDFQCGANSFFPLQVQFLSPFFYLIKHNSYLYSIQWRKNCCNENFAQKACSAVHQTAIGQKNQKVDKQLHSRVHGDKIQGLLYYNYIVHNI